ncbi:MAG: hypothetical protein Q8928_04760 [Bacteroidota bacterium]|nr:hypothetical protein [Bacteroidota bacterium]
MEIQEKIETVQSEEKVLSMAVEFEKEYLTEDIQKAANWFFWIAALSLINSLIYWLSTGMYFVVGLGVTQIVDGIVSGLMNGPSWIALIPNLMITGFFVFIGYRSRKYDKWAFVVGVVVYTLDALLYLYFKEWMAVGFHVFALVMISKGFFKVFEYDKACKQISE